MAQLYRHFAKDWESVLDFSDECQIELFNSESYGTPCRSNNGFLWGKKWLNVNVAMWLEDQRRGHLVLSELYSDSKFPHWWLDNIFGLSEWDELYPKPKE